MDFNGLLRFIEKEDMRLKEYYNHYSDQEKRILARAVKLSEEVGELCNEILAFNSMQRTQKLDNRNKENLPEEFADVVLTAMLLAKSMNIDIKTAIENKIAKINKRYAP